MTSTEELERAIDDTLPSGCGGCGRSLPRPGLQCPECQAWPDITREEQAALLSVPGELTLHRADVAEARALDLLQAFAAASAVPDRLRKQAEIEGTQAWLQGVLEAVGGDHAAASGKLAVALEAEAEARRPLDECLELYREAVAELEAAERTMAGPKAEVQARVEIAQCEPVLEKYQRLYDQAAAVSASARLDVEQAELDTSKAEVARDEQAARLLHVEEVRPSARRVALLAHPLVRYAAELARTSSQAALSFPASGPTCWASSTRWPGPPACWRWPRRTPCRGSWRTSRARCHAPGTSPLSSAVPPCRTWRCRPRRARRR